VSTLTFIDTHVHLLHADRFTYPWCVGQPALAGNHTLADYRRAAAAAPATIAALCFMEADVPPTELPAETAFFSDLVGADDAQPALTALIAGARPETAAFPAQLEGLRTNPRVRGLRRVLHTQPDAVLTSPLLVENLRRLAGTGLVFDLCVRPRQLPLITALVTVCPETEFVLDHAGAPDVAGGDLTLWRSGLSALAERPNVACKFSGLGSLADPARPLTPQVQPVFDHCFACFGAERMVWGSDWPVAPALAAWVKTTVMLIGALSPADQSAIAAKNGRRIYRLS
jgi:predicted TIM-barrel fold metal-dependent hydrolase